MFKNKSYARAHTMAVTERQWHTPGTHSDSHTNDYTLLGPNVNADKNGTTNCSQTTQWHTHTQCTTLLLSKTHIHTHIHWNYILTYNNTAKFYGEKIGFTHLWYIILKLIIIKLTVLLLLFFFFYRLKQIFLKNVQPFWVGDIFEQLKKWGEICIRACGQAHWYQRRDFVVIEWALQLQCHFFFCIFILFWFLRFLV